MQYYNYIIYAIKSNACRNGQIELETNTKTKTRTSILQQNNNNNNNNNYKFILKYDSLLIRWS